jgi:HD-GYP domain-containing protein (c-di-GMP phosphodiesterase class II)
MSDIQSMNEQADSPEPHLNFSPRMYGIVVLVLGIIVTSVFFVMRYTEMDLARDLQTWQEKLNLIAESRTDDLNHWVSGEFTELRTLADNPSLQLYISELQAMEGAQAESEPAQKAYLRNLLLFTAERAGYSASGAISGIHANVQEDAQSGLAVLDSKGNVVVSTAMPQGELDKLVEQARSFPAAQEVLIDLLKTGDDKTQIGFAVPIFSIQGERNAASQIGRVVGLKTINGDLFNLLKHPGVTEQTLEGVLVRKVDGKMEFLSPLLDGSGSLTKQVEIDSRRLAESALLETTGNFVSDKVDYRNKRVLATSRPIMNTPWTLVVKIDRKEALTESDQRRASMMMFFFFIIASIVLIILAVWWHAHSKRAMMMSYHFRKLAAEARAQEQLLRLVADNQPEPIYILDHDMTYRFANAKSGEEMDMTPDNMVGKSLNDVHGTSRAEKIATQCGKAAQTQQVQYGISQVLHHQQERIIRSAYVPIAHIPVATLPQPTPGVLVVEQDISEIVHEREQRISTQHQLIQTLIKLVDRRDPYAADHSLMVSHIACEIAIDMELDNVLVETTRIAGNLMNIGKIIVPTELLTKTESLSDAEKQVIYDSMHVAADLIRNVRFDGPVADTLSQWQERWDGAGPKGIKGEDILISARIIAVANAFIGMISPRSWRTAIAINAANKFLLDQSDTVFDRRVVVALINYVENHNGHVWINKMLEQKKRVA